MPNSNKPSLEVLLQEFNLLARSFSNTHTAANTLAVVKLNLNVNAAKDESVVIGSTIHLDPAITAVSKASAMSVAKLVQSVFTNTEYCPISVTASSSVNQVLSSVDIKLIPARINKMKILRTETVALRVGSITYGMLVRSAPNSPAVVVLFDNQSDYIEMVQMQMAIFASAKEVLPTKSFWQRIFG